MKKKVEKPSCSENCASILASSWRQFSMRNSVTRVLTVLAGVVLATSILLAPAPAFAVQTPSPTYQPKFHGDPARSDSEAAALGYMRVVIRAQRQFNKQYDHFATSLAELVHSGSFTKRMVNPDRGDYTASFEGKKDSFILTLTPKQLDAAHRSFYAEDNGKIHANEEKPAEPKPPAIN